MPRSRTLLLALALLALVAAPALAASAPVTQHDPQPTAAPELTALPAPVAGGCAPAFDLEPAPVTPDLEVPAAGAAEPGWLQGPPFLKKYCRCGCGITCQTSADCGGDPCQAFITCC